MPARPGAVVIQADSVCAAFEPGALLALTAYDMPGAATRVRIDPTAANGLQEAGFAMAEKPFTVRADRLGSRIGVLDAPAMAAISHALTVALGLAAEDGTGGG